MKALHVRCCAWARKAKRRPARSNSFVFQRFSRARGGFVRCPNPGLPRARFSKITPPGPPLAGGGAWGRPGEVTFWGGGQGRILSPARLLHTQVLWGSAFAHCTPRNSGGGRGRPRRRSRAAAALNSWGAGRARHLEAAAKGWPGGSSLFKASAGKAAAPRAVKTMATVAFWLGAAHTT